MNEFRNAKDVVKAMRVYYQTHGWTQGSYFRWDAGSQYEEGKENACLMGAMCAVLGVKGAMCSMLGVKLPIFHSDKESELITKTSELVKAAAESLDYSCESIVDLNDHHLNSKEQVVQILATAEIL